MGDPGAPIAVIVDQSLGSQGLGPDDETRVAEGTKARDGADDPAGRDVDGRQAAGLGGRRSAGGGRRAAGEEQSAGGEGAEARNRRRGKIGMEGG
jgi:hypothetical protein